VLLAAVALTGCSPDTAVDRGGAATAPSPSTASSATEGATPAVVERPLLLSFASGAGADGVFTQVWNSGSADLDVTVETWGGGRLETAGSFAGRGARFPAFSRTDPAYAVLRVTNRGAVDALSPGDADFVYGVDVRIDDVTTGSPGDDGDNVLQRGLFEQHAQYKLQVDGGRPTCRVAGLEGDVIASLDLVLEPGQWYRLRCTREANLVGVAAVRLVDGQPASGWVKAAQQGDTGVLVMPPETPLTVGGKLSHEGDLMPSSTDQFNGVMDRVYLRVLD
jgi:hypothetical protein